MAYAQKACELGVQSWKTFVTWPCHRVTSGIQCPPYSVPSLSNPCTLFIVFSELLVSFQESPSLHRYGVIYWPDQTATLDVHFFLKNKFTKKAHFIKIVWACDCQG